MGETKQINIKNYYFYNDMIHLKDFDAILLKIDKKSYKNFDIYYIGYITIKKIDDYKSIYSVNPLYLRINHASGNIGEKNGNKYWFCSWKQRSIKKYADVWDGINNKIKAINGGEENDYGKDYIEIKFNSDDNLPLNKPLKFHAMTITLPTTFFRWHFVWIIKMLQYERIDASEGIDVNKTSLSKECELCHYWFFKDVDLNLKSIFVMDVMIY